MAIQPLPGMQGGYFSLECSLRVEVVSYQEFDNHEKFKLKVLKNLNRESNCEYKEGEEFLFERKKSDSEGSLEGLTLD